MSPPNTGPKANANPPKLPNQLMAFWLSFVENTEGKIDGPNGKIIAPATPCQNRHKISQ